MPPPLADAIAEDAGNEEGEEEVALSVTETSAGAADGLESLHVHKTLPLEACQGDAGSLLIC